ncbi:hypothetical protein CDAR_51711, partial [Caerostris darwini]
RRDSIVPCGTQCRGESIFPVAVTAEGCGSPTHAPLRLRNPGYRLIGRIAKRSPLNDPCRPALSPTPFAFWDTIVD